MQKASEKVPETSQPSNEHRWLLTPSEGTYEFVGRARLPETASPPGAFGYNNGRLEWRRDGDLWRFVGRCEGYPPRSSTMATFEDGRLTGTAENELIHDAIMDAIWDAGGRAARVDRYGWVADDDGAYTMTGDLVRFPYDEETGSTGDRPEAVSADDRDAAITCLRAVFGGALTVGDWDEIAAGRWLAPVIAWCP